MKPVKLTVVYAALIAVAVYTSLLPASYAQEGLGPSELLRQTTNRILQSLNDRRDEFTADPTLLRAVVEEDLIPLIDLRYSSRLILGRSGRGISETQLDAFANALSGVLTSRYSDGLLRFNSKEQVDILPLRGNNTDKLTRVQTRIKLPSGKFAPIDYAFRKTDDGWKAFDVTVEGISYVITLRNQIAPRVAEAGIDQVTADLLAGNLEIND